MTETKLAEAKHPEDCQTMLDVRAGVDATDRALIELLDRRFGYMRAAARIKTDRNAVRDEARKAQVIEAARADAANRDLPAEEIAAIWNSLVEASIAYELVEWDRIRSDA
ncbi:chorismate mutase [Erythrobacter sp. SDW2]|uniref:chorismate mutase n=1 Tax=Erythrobacter sp. SDW2 TaxID=2907154 RepID=UPI001F3FCD0E|nr:chorismate mutase [Erythrobacter sp. SDW2]UIP05870.1 chorismate mutase [Erythrobacter sp. SDW2]